MAKEIVCDTSTIITLFSAHPLSTNNKKILGVAGHGGITDCDIACLSLAIERDIPLFIDDFKAQFHFSSFFCQ